MISGTGQYQLEMVQHKTISSTNKRKRNSEGAGSYILQLEAPDLQKSMVSGKESPDGLLKEFLYRRSSLRCHQRPLIASIH
jgi:hypothetical protein